jgi:predicted transcriptional regulator
LIIIYLKEIIAKCRKSKKQIGKSIEGKDDIKSEIIANCLIGNTIINRDIHWTNTTIRNYLSPEQLSICCDVYQKIDENNYNNLKKQNDNMKLQGFIKFVNAYNEYWKTNLQITGVKYI